MEIFQTFYAAHPFAVTLIITAFIGLALIKIISMISKVIFAASVIGIAYYFLGMTPEQQKTFNENAKVILEPILGKIENMTPSSFSSEVSNKMKDSYNNFVNNN